MMPAQRPHIGITTSLHDGEQRLDLRYVRAVERAGGLPLPVPMLKDDEAVGALALLLDGLVVTGGPAITEGLIGSLPDEIAPTPRVRLESDSRLLQHFLDAERPVLAICYGMQLASALRGGTIYADVEAQHEGARTHSEKRGGTEHPVAVVAGTHLRHLLGTDQVVVNTRHLQAVAEPGEGLVISARAPDGIIEALESPNGRFIGVQFHPERMGAPLARLFSHLVEMARTPDQ